MANGDDTSTNAGENRPPQVALAAAVGGFVGAVVGVIVAGMVAG